MTKICLIHEFENGFQLKKFSRFRTDYLLRSHISTGIYVKYLSLKSSIFSDFFSAKICFPIISVIDSLTKTFKTHDTCDGWESFRDEKFFKLFPNSFQDFESARTLCHEQNRNSELMSIRSEKEQEFILNYVSQTNFHFDDIWIGAKRDPKNLTNFVFEDKTSVEFSNFEQNDKNNENCLVLQFSNNENNGISGNWRIVSCLKRNLVLCQYWLNPTNIQLNVKIADLRDDFEGTTIDSKDKFKKLNKNFENANKQMDDLKSDLTDSRISIARMTLSLIDLKIVIVELRDEVKELKKTLRVKVS